MEKTKISIARHIILCILFIVSHYAKRLRKYFIFSLTNHRRELYSPIDRTGKIKRGFAGDVAT